MINSDAISYCNPVVNQFHSWYFLAKTKLSGGYRFILNLKYLNEYIEHPHFKMNYYRIGSTLKEAYLLILIHRKFRNFLRFNYRTKIFEFNRLEFNGLNIAPFIFTKLMKPVLTILSLKGIICSAYLDDFIIIVSSLSECIGHTLESISLLTRLGLTVNFENSKIIPSNRQYFWWIFNSVILYQCI